MSIEIEGTFKYMHINEDGECELDLCPANLDTQLCCLFCPHLHKCSDDRVCSHLRIALWVSLPFKRAKFIE